MLRLRPKADTIEPFFALYVMKSDYFVDMARSLAQRAVNQASINTASLRRIAIPLPPLEIQREIVEEIEGHQRVIDGARAVVDNWRPRVEVDPAWPKTPIFEIADLLRGITFRKSDQLENATDNSVEIVTTKAAQYSGIVPSAVYHIPRNLVKTEDKLLQRGDILISTANSLSLLGRTTYVNEIDRPMSFGAFMTVIRARSDVLPNYLLHCLRSAAALEFFFRNANTTTNISNLPVSSLGNFQVALPPLPVQQTIVAEIEREQALVDSNGELIERFEKKIETTIARVWTE